MLGSIVSVVCIVADEEEPDKYSEYFNTITEMADLMLGILYSENPNRTKFNFDSYTIIPLLLTGVKCRDMIIRRRAISNMLNYHRREGVCDSVCLGKLCEWAMIVEEKHLEDGRVPGWARVHGVTLRRDPEKEESGILTCQQRVSATSDEVVIRSTSISWNFLGHSRARRMQSQTTG